MANCAIPSKTRAPSPPAPSEDELAAAHALAEPSNGGRAGDDTQLEAVRAELAASLAREQDLRTALSDQLEAREHDLDLERDFATRAAELDGRAAKLATAQTDLEERERRLAARLEAVKEDERRLGDLQVRLDREEAASAERERDIEAKIRELKEADRERAKGTTELSKHAGAIADREKKLARAEAALAARA